MIIKFQADEDTDKAMVAALNDKELEDALKDVWRAEAMLAQELIDRGRWPDSEAPK